MWMIRDTQLLFRRQVRLALRNPSWMIFGLFQPILYLVLFGPLFAGVFRRGLTGAGGNAYGYFVPGLLIELGLFGSAFVGFRVIADWRFGVIDRLRVTPVSRLAILVGRVLRDVVTLLIQAVVLVLVGLAFGLRAPIAGVLIGFGFIVAVTISLSALSYTAGLFCKDEDVLGPVVNMLVMPLVLLSGIMLPMTVGPGWLQGIARATPFRYIINAMREAYAGHYFNPIMAEGIAVALGMVPLCLWIGGRAFLRENA